MKRVPLLLIVLLILSSCGKSKDEAGNTRTDSKGQAQQSVQDEQPQETQAGEVRPFSEFERLVGASLRPYFNQEGTDSLKTVAPGDYFDLYVFAEFNKDFGMMAAEYKLVVPLGITVLGSDHADITKLSLGSYDVDFMIAFQCLRERRWLVKYQCKADDDFEGGVIETIEGQNLNFIGYSMCDGQGTEVRAWGGVAEVVKK
ncbi:MAG: hypothetical protein OEN01_02275 [Candidatus Krumholzibacteria bacterium]|nr:hypothetical protein [Candidatus Krumholzibacteria bacterium]